jgi:hypothetical protein
LIDRLNRRKRRGMGKDGIEKKLDNPLEADDIDNMLQ